MNKLISKINYIPGQLELTIRPVTLRSLPESVAHLNAAGEFSTYSYFITPHIQGRHLSFLLTLNTPSIETSTLHQLVRQVVTPFLEWTREVLKEKTNTIKEAKAVTPNDPIIEAFLKNPNFQVNCDGSILEKHGSIWKVKELSPHHGIVRLKYQGKNILVSRAVYRKFIGPLNPCLIISHKDGNKLNLHKDNLFAQSLSERGKETFKQGRKVVKGNCVLNETHLARIKELRAEGISYQGILSICQSEAIPLKSKGHLSAIVTNKIWN